MDAGGLAVLKNNLTVDPDGVNTHGLRLRFAKVGTIGDQGRIEQDQIGEVPGRDAAAIGKPHIRGGKTRHLSNRLLHAEQLALGHVRPQHFRKAPEAAGMEAERLPIAAHVRERPLQQTLDVGVCHPTPRFACGCRR